MRDQTGRKESSLDDAIAAVRDDVPPGALAVSAGPQRTIEGWVERKRPGSAAAEAARAAREATEGANAEDDQTT